MEVVFFNGEIIPSYLHFTFMLWFAEDFNFNFSIVHGSYFRSTVFRIRISNTFLKFEFLCFEIGVRITESVTTITEIILEIELFRNFHFRRLGFISWLDNCGDCEVNI